MTELKLGDVVLADVDDATVRALSGMFTKPNSLKRWINACITSPRRSVIADSCLIREDESRLQQSPYETFQVTIELSVSVPTSEL